MNMYASRTADSIEMTFVAMGRMGPKNHVLDRARSLRKGQCFGGKCGDVWREYNTYRDSAVQRVLKLHWAISLLLLLLLWQFHVWFIFYGDNYCQTIFLVCKRSYNLRQWLYQRHIFLINCNDCYLIFILALSLGFTPSFNHFLVVIVVIYSMILQLQYLHGTE